MKKDNVAIVVSSILISVMILIVTIMAIFVGNNFSKKTSVSSDTEASFVAGQSVDKQISDTDNQSEAETYIEAHEVLEDEIRQDVKEDGSYTIAIGDSSVSGVFLSDNIDLSIEDFESHSVTYENSYTNSVELLPSLFYEHEPISRDKVSTDNFPDSYAGKETTSIVLTNAKKEEYDALTVPKEITLYNVKAKQSDSFTINASATGEKGDIESIGWSTSDSTVLSLSKTTGNTVTVSRISDYVGDAYINVNVSYKENSRYSTTEELRILVHIEDMEDDNTPIYSKENVKLYADEEGTKVATLSDYATQDIFYGESKILGWQTIDGNTYYYNSDSVAVTGEQVIGGLKYTFDENGALIAGAGQKGIDVSLYQSHIDWSSVAASGIDFAIIRCGFRGAATGSLVEDSRFRENIEGAKAAGLRVGVYFYTQARTESEGVEEAIMALGLCQDYSLDLPIFVDSENMQGGRANDLDQDTRTRAVLAFCQTIEQHGRRAGVYASKYWFYNNLHASQLEQYDIWVAQYNTDCTYDGKKNYWQYSSKEHIEGIVGNVDMNIVME